MSTPPPPGYPTVAGPGIAGPTGAKPRRAWIVVLGLALGTIVLIGVAGTALFVTRTLPPLSAASGFLNDVADANAAAATGRLCAADREDPRAALQVVTDHFTLRSGTITENPLSVDRDGDRATVEYTIKSGTDRTYQLPLRREHGTWKACPGDELR